jgi:hypothetical protein
VVRISRRLRKSTRINGKHFHSAMDPKTPLILLSRGRVSVYTVPTWKNSNGIPFLHTTNIRAGKIERDAMIKVRHDSSICGPAVLLPRVGRPSVEKVCLIGEADEFVLSDCILGLLCEDKSAAKVLKKQIVNNWDLLSSSYVGTGAPYITTTKVAVLLRQLGFNVSRVY